jgi:hypothetical protein
MRFVDLKEQGCENLKFPGRIFELTYHYDAVTREERVYEGLSEEHSVCHVQNAGSLFAADVLESDRVAHLVT